MDDVMMFPETVEEFMEKNKIVDTQEVYTNGAELVPIFRMNQWFEHVRGEPRDDSISRQAAIEALACTNPTEPYIDYDDAVEAINNVPSIEERKTGRWIDMGDFEQCSVCTGTRLKEIQTMYGKAIWIRTQYCPNCGAMMVRGEEHEPDIHD